MDPFSVEINNQEYVKKEHLKSCYRCNRLVDTIQHIQAILKDGIKESEQVISELKQNNFAVNAIEMEGYRRGYFDASKEIEEMLEHNDDIKDVLSEQRPKRNKK